ncbi:hypothetical protein PPEP_a2758 [Pseudoalteromonas peptidolytica F12-50-A1]|uniref:Uncharacterized protein n=1 Tax=Pseudoalteromonas peptidolytica F12-50-A1 TaxID=1315280 RepID=A0A8I0MX02_9GAMM|nr:hypothetical protein [Pseudoalteromonas peptidolytica F12-50-A1]
MNASHACSNSGIFSVIKLNFYLLSIKTVLLYSLIFDLTHEV